MLHDEPPSVIIRDRHVSRQLVERLLPGRRDRVAVHLFRAAATSADPDAEHRHHDSHSDKQTDTS
jgi:hypothetical protein